MVTVLGLIGLIGVHCNCYNPLTQGAIIFMPKRQKIDRVGAINWILCQALIHFQFLGNIVFPSGFLSFFSYILEHDYITQAKRS